MTRTAPLLPGLLPGPTAPPRPPRSRRASDHGPDWRPGTGSRSADELQLRDAAELWLRARVPGCRVVHELVVGARRIDVAAVGPSGAPTLVGVEIKSRRDTLARLPAQLAEFGAYLPEVWVVAAEKFLLRGRSAGPGGPTGSGAAGDPYSLTVPARPGSLDGVRGTASAALSPGTGLLRPGPAGLTVDLPAVSAPIEGSRDSSGRVRGVGRRVAPRWLLDLLWRDELHRAAVRRRLWSPRGTPPRRRLIGALVEALTGPECLAEVCAELRGRDALWRADPPVVGEGGP